jgi:hypothetical protein
MKPLLALLALLLSAAVAAADTESRFSQVLSTAERAEIGLDRFTSDQVAVLDALVRRDINAKSGGRAENQPAIFSQRLTPDERRNAGLNILTPSELARLDALVERHAAARLARTLLAPPIYISRAQRLDPDKTKKPAEREIHGSFSLSYGFGSGGYSEKTGSMVLRMEDPEHHYSISVGYSESQIKGPGGYLYRGDAYPYRAFPDEP